MPLNSVTVTASWLATGFATGQYPEGNYQFTASGTLMDSSSIALVFPVFRGVLINGAFSQALLASDNFTAGFLTWDVLIRVQGMEVIDFRNFAINYSAGASQGLFGILQTAGWVAPSEPT